MKGVSESGIRCLRRAHRNPWGTVALSTPRNQKSRARLGSIIGAKSMPEQGAAKCFAYLQTTTQSRAALFELMNRRTPGQSAGDFLSDGADDVRELPLYLSPESEHVAGLHEISLQLSKPKNVIALIFSPRSFVPAAYDRRSTLPRSALGLIHRNLDEACLKIWRITVHKLELTRNRLKN